MATKFLEDKIITQQIKDLSEDTLEQFISDAYAVSDDNLEKVYKKIVKVRADLGSEFSGKLSESIDDLAYFMEDSDNRFLVRWAKRRIRKVEAIDLKKEIAEKFGSHLNGVELSNKAGDQHTLITPDASNPNSFRSTYFYSGGFSYHDTHDTYEEVLIGVIGLGYKVLNPGILDKLSQTKEFIDGNENLRKAQKNMIEEATDKLNPINKKSKIKI